MGERIKTILYIIGAFIAITGSVWGTTTYFAKASELEQLSMRLEQKIQADQIFYLQQRLWELYKYYGTEDCKSMPEPSKGECRVLKAKLKQLKGG
jgi:hypothetical protein